MSETGKKFCNHGQQCTMSKEYLEIRQAAETSLLIRHKTNSSPAPPEPLPIQPTTPSRSPSTAAAAATPTSKAAVITSPTKTPTNTVKSALTLAAAAAAAKPGKKIRYRRPHHHGEGVVGRDGRPVSEAVTRTTTTVKNKEQEIKKQNKIMRKKAGNKVHYWAPSPKMSGVFTSKEAKQRLRKEELAPLQYMLTWTKMERRFGPEGNNITPPLIKNPLGKETCRFQYML